MPTRALRLFCCLRQAGIACAVMLSIGNACAQGLDCYDRALPMPKTVTMAMADSCHGKVSTENTTNDKHAIALYNAARFYVVLGEQEPDVRLKTAAYDSAVADILESRDRALDTNVAFTTPWRKGDKRSLSAQMDANRFFLANRSYQLGKAYLELGKLGGARACVARDVCFEKAAAELEKDSTARAAGGFRNDYIFLRANVYLAWGQSIPARRDLELLKDAPTYGALAAQKLGEMYLADAQRELAQPITLSGVLSARIAFKSALGVPATAMDGQLGMADTFLLEAGLVTKPGDRRVRYADAAREYELAIVMAGSRDASSERRRAHEGRGTALFELARLGDTQTLGQAISELKIAAGLQAGISGASAQLMLARALAEAGRGTESDVAYAEAEHRFGADPRAVLARAERSYASGKRLYASGDDAGARERLQSALAEAAWRDGRPDAFYFLSEIDLRTGQNAVANADAAMAAGGGASPYREQACLARVAAGGPALRKKAAMPACAGDDLLIGLFYLRHAQLTPTAATANASRRLAQDAFTRARASDVVFPSSAVSDALRVSDLALFGSAVALGCSSSAGLDVPIDLDAARLAAARAFFILHRVYACVATN